jgi:hypothetical protein
MTTQPPQSRASDDWNSLTPWQMATEWHKEAPGIADRVMALATQYAQRQWKLEEQRADHGELMDKRLWWTQIIGILGGVVSVGIFGAVSLQYAAAGHIVPGLAALGLGTGATAGGIYGVRRSIESVRKQMRSQSSAPADEPLNS